ncbi:Phage portal protein, SPP1 Gp6 [Mycobacterium sp. JS623]|nr:Phage portal protein, SPP1 Gp6 [Mycobacterium sp. JS623]
MSSPLLIEMLQRIDAGVHRRTENTAYWRGKQPLAFLSPESRAALGNRMGVLAVNFPRVQITSLTERLRVAGFSGSVDPWPDFISNDLDQLADVIHKEALLQGQSFCLVWSDEQGNPRATVESAENVAVKRDPVTREVVVGCKRIRVKTTPTTVGYTEAWIYLPDEVQHWRSNSPGGSGEFELLEVVPNPLGLVPVVPFVNADLLPLMNMDPVYLEESGASEIDPLKCLVDGLNKTLADLAVAQEFTARPRRWATGIEATEQPVLDADGNPVLVDGEPIMEAVSPIPEGNRAMLASNDAAKFGQLDGANLAGFRTAVDVWIQAVMAVSALPAHMCGITTANPSTADAIRAAEAGLTSRAESKQLMFGRSWEAVARLLAAIRAGVNPSTVAVKVAWSPADTRSQAAEADAAQKLYSSGILSRTAILRRLGLTDGEIAEELDNVQRDASIGADISIGRYVRDAVKPSPNPAHQ